ncbi:DUF3307 domain-containing protein [Cryomorpha ignava]|uniref:DUF3307 domain-containing protein n=1 Tax=Cryomorpha ignava TaxID=101383 RepID=A0A7K3WS08_9FLAO|nr:DUF3307 domain-containing protein [Cryomorpha ignava]NEN24460.1 DUF3307 domain-containing protein [Cryomorpha ignava]
MSLLIKFILAHLIGDFFLQTAKSIGQKNNLKWRSPQLYIHTVVHFALLLLIAGLNHWVAALIITVFHFLIDGSKLQFQNEKNKQTWFFLDQLLHLIVMVAVWAYITQVPKIEISAALLAGGTALIFLTRPASFFIYQALSHWGNEMTEEGQSQKALPKAGSYIGMLERALVFGFILIGQWGAIGFLMAAKSIFRFGDLTRAKDRKLTEYILIGTLMSFGLAILAGMIFTYYFSQF